jgi:hypothetical protein
MGQYKGVAVSSAVTVLIDGKLRGVALELRTQLLKSRRGQRCINRVVTPLAVKPDQALVVGIINGKTGLEVLEIELVEPFRKTRNHRLTAVHAVEVIPQVRVAVPAGRGCKRLKRRLESEKRR